VKPVTVSPYTPVGTGYSASTSAPYAAQFTGGAAQVGGSVLAVAGAVAAAMLV
jgi:hypothetical protein